MIKYITLFAFCLISISSYSQTYLNESCAWKIKDFAYVDLLYFNTDYTDHIKGDTFINGLNYLKLYRQGVSISGFTQVDSLYTNEFNEYRGAVRESNKIWHWIEKDSLEPTVLYDFNKQEGDSIKWMYGPTNYNLILKDSLLQNGTYKKVYTLEGTFIEFIEGVGFNTGLIKPLMGIDSYSYLQCFNNNDEFLNPDLSEFDTVIGDSFEDVDTCDKPLLNHQVSIPHKQDLDVYPNPFTTDITLVTEINIKQIEIFNQLGVKVFSEKQHTKTIKLNHLDAGLYFLVIKDNHNQSISKKLIKH